jgi:hypothetical protein
MPADLDSANDHAPRSVPPVFDTHRSPTPDPLGWQKNLPNAPDDGLRAQQAGKGGTDKRRRRADPAPKRPRGSHNNQ